MKPVFKFIYKNEGSRRIAIGDIHGCYQTFYSLLFHVIDITKNDQIFLLGDYIDRGKGSVDVLDLIIGLMEEGYNIVPLRGNHEQTLLEYQREEFRFFEWHLKKENMLSLLNAEKLKDKYNNFFNSLPHYIEVDNFFLVHAGFDFAKEKPFEDINSMLWIKNFAYDKQKLKGKRVIFGHNPHGIDEIKEKIKNRTNCIPIDNGAYYTKRHKIYDIETMGNLCALNIDTFELFVQKNIE